MSSSSETYTKMNGLQRLEAKIALDKFGPMFEWRGDGTDSLIDVGSGPGDVTIDFILPLMPSNFGRLVGADYSDSMIVYAREKYPLPNVRFEPFDLEEDLEDQPFNDNFQPFDHLTSFFCLHLVSDRENAVRNLAKLLKPGGDMIVLFFSHISPNDAFKKFKAKHAKWAEYLGDAPELFSPSYQSVDNPQEEFEEYLGSFGFTDHIVEVKTDFYIYDGTQAIKDTFAVVPFGDMIPEAEMDDFFDDLLPELFDNGLIAMDDPANAECRYQMPYTLFLVYAKKDI